MLGRFSAVVLNYSKFSGKRNDYSFLVEVLNSLKSVEVVSGFKSDQGCILNNEVVTSDNSHSVNELLPMCVMLREKHYF